MEKSPSSEASNLKNEMIRNRFIPNELSFKQLKAYQYLLFNQIDN
jgi:hypothetical protein